MALDLLLVQLSLREAAMRYLVFPMVAQSVGKSDVPALIRALENLGVGRQAQRDKQKGSGKSCLDHENVILSFFLTLANQ